jgi:adenosylcobinamide-GDP ribazoletransferase
MIRMMPRAFVAALTYLTVCRVPARWRLPGVAEAIPFYPVVGFCVGVFLVVADKGMATLLHAPRVVDVMVLALWIGITGGLHLDGLADAFDGLGGGRTRERALEIMRDSRIGAFGATSIVIVLALKGACLAELGAGGRWRALLVAPVLGRLAPLILARLAPAARRDGEGQRFIVALRWPAVAIASATALVVVGATLKIVALPIIAGAVALLLALTAVFRARLGGVTGDTLGAAVELVETGTLVTLAAVSGHGWLPR